MNYQTLPYGNMCENITIILTNTTVREYKVVDLYLFYMKVTISESKLTKVIHNYIDSSFEGFDNCYYDWADFNCGMGICCDPYAIGFVLPDREYDDLNWLIESITMIMVITLRNLKMIYLNLAKIVLT